MIRATGKVIQTFHVPVSMPLTHPQSHSYPFLPQVKHRMYALPCAETEQHISLVNRLLHIRNIK